MSCCSTTETLYERLVKFSVNVIPSCSSKLVGGMFEEEFVCAAAVSSLAGRNVAGGKGFIVSPECGLDDIFVDDGKKGEGLSASRIAIMKSEDNLLRAILRQIEKGFTSHGRTRSSRAE